MGCSDSDSAQITPNENNKEIMKSQDSNSELIKIYRNKIDISISNSSQIKPYKNENNKSDSKPPKINVISTFETDNFDINEYKFIPTDSQGNNIQNINKMYVEYINDEEIYFKEYNFFITLDYSENKTIIVEIQKCIKYTNEKNTQHLKKQVIEGCNLDYIKPFLGKYNYLFCIDMNPWLQAKNTTDIYVFAEKVYFPINMAIVQLFYEKDLKKLDYSITNSNIQTSNTINKTSLNINPIEVQNLFLDIVVDSTILTINIPPPIPVVRKKKEEKVKKNNESKNNNYNNKNNNNYNNYSYNNSSNNNSSNNNSEKNDDKSGSKRSYKYDNGEIDKNGYIKDKSNEVVGQFDDKVVRGRDGCKVGEYDFFGYFKDSYGNTAGGIDNLGVVRDKDGNKLGEIDHLGIVRDADGAIIGDVGDMPKEQAAYLYFLK